MGSRQAAVEVEVAKCSRYCAAARWCFILGSIAHNRRPAGGGIRGRNHVRGGRVQGTAWFHRPAIWQPPAVFLFP